MTVWEALEAKYDKAIADAFERAVADLRAGADLGRILTALQRGDLAEAIAAMNLDEAAMNRLVVEIETAFREAGDLAASEMPPLTDQSGARVIFRFNVRNPAAERWLREHSSRLVTDIMEDQRVAIRAALERGMARGDNPRTTALDIVGRLNKVSKQREGGIIGLTSQQEQFVSNARYELEQGGDANYFKRALRDKRYDRTIKKAMDAGEPISPETITAAIRSYKNRLLKYRADAIGRSESLTALRKAENDAYRQAVEDGKVDQDAIIKDWDSTGDRKVRNSHVVLDGQTRRFMEPFVSPTGARMQFPGDTSLGAPASEIIQCRCRARYRIDFLAAAFGNREPA